MFSLARRAASRAGFTRALDLTRVVTTSASQEAAAAAAAAPAAKPANVQEFQIYRWDPDTGGKPRYQTYKVRGRASPGAHANEDLAEPRVTSARCCR